jgi:hypothetical protein
MTKEDKRLLLKDLCSRLPYQTYVEWDDGYALLSIDRFKDIVSNKFGDDWKRPYLRPLSDMTEEEEKELRKDYNYHIYGDQIRLYYHSEGYWDTDNDTYSNDYLDLFEWLMDHHFDFRGLIKKGLALVALEGMYD